MERVSIIVPVYNVQKYLKGCLSSIVAQTYRNKEIIVIDDGSTDRSGEIAEEFAEAYSEVTVYHKDNGGLSSARNYGIEIAKGEYIVFIDSDDYVDSNFIKDMMDNSDNADLVISNYCKVNESGRPLIQDKKIKSSQIWNRYDFWENYYFKGLWITCEVTWNKLYKSSLFNKLRFPNQKLHEDEFVIQSIVDQCNYIKVINKENYYYVQRNNSIMHRNDYKGNLDLTEALLKRYKTFSLDKNERMIKIRECALESASLSLVFGFFEEKNRFKKQKSIFCKLVRIQLKDKFSIKLFIQSMIVNFPRIYSKLYQIVH